MIKGKAIVTVSSASVAPQDQADFACTGENDQDVINEAIHSLPSTGGKVLLLPGTYNIAKPIVPDVDNLEVAGTNRGATIVRAACDLQAGLFHDLSPSLAKPRKDLVMRDMTLDGTMMAKDGGFANKGIYIAYLSRAVFENLHVYNVGATGIGVDFLFDSVIQNNIVDKCGHPSAGTGNSGIGVGTGGEAEEPLLIVGNHVEGCGLAGILLEVQKPGASRFLHHIVSQNVVRNNRQHGILMRGLRRALISNNLVIGNQNDGIRLATYQGVEPGDVLIGNNMAQGNGAWGINIESPEATDVQIVANNLSGNGLGGTCCKARSDQVSLLDNVGDSTNRIVGDLTVTGRRIFVHDLPGTDPGVAGQLWRDGDTVRVSRG